MKITDNISANLAAWMSASSHLDTLKKVSSRAKVGFGTVRRIKNGDGNPTINNLHDIAHAFGYRVEDLIAPVDHGKNIVSLAANEPAPAAYSSIAHDLLNLAESMNEKGQWQLLGMAKALVHEYPKIKKPRKSTM